MASDNESPYPLPTRIEDLTTEWFQAALRVKYPGVTLREGRVEAPRC